MKFRTKYDLIAADYKAGDIVWGCAFASFKSKEKCKLRQEPQQGILALAYTESENNELRRILSDDDKKYGIAYFVPVRKNGTPSWSRAVKIGSRLYASTKEDCIELYNECIHKEIEKLNNIIADLQSQYIGIYLTKRGD
jgi:hypothetical protein